MAGHNHEGYRAPTASDAVDLVTQEKAKEARRALDQEDAERMDQALKLAKATFEAYGFEVVERIVLRNMRTGRIYR